MKRLALKFRDAGVTAVTECVLPVEYDRAARVALECIGERTPGLVLSLGAGGCEVDFETRGRNRDNTWAADNAGVLRNRNTEIVAGGPEYLALNAPMTEIFRHSPRQGSLGRLSDDAGAYVCNNTAYRLAREFTKPDSKTKYGFVHVPPTTCSARVADPETIAETIFAGVRGAMPELF
jgi:pyroglutamyl-peptidase